MLALTTPVGTPTSVVGANGSPVDAHHGTVGASTGVVGLGNGLVGTHRAGVTPGKTGRSVAHGFVGTESEGAGKKKVPANPRADLGASDA